MKEYPLTCPMCKGSLKIDRRLAPKGQVYVCANKICRSGHPVRKQHPHKRTMAEIDLAEESKGLDYGAETEP